MQVFYTVWKRPFEFCWRKFYCSLMFVLMYVLTFSVLHYILYLIYKKKCYVQLYITLLPLFFVIALFHIVLSWKESYVPCCFPRCLWKTIELSSSSRKQQAGHSSDWAERFLQNTPFHILRWAYSSYIVHGWRG